MFANWFLVALLICLLLIESFALDNIIEYNNFAMRPIFWNKSHLTLIIDNKPTNFLLKNFGLMRTFVGYTYFFHLPQWHEILCDRGEAESKISIFNTETETFYELFKQPNIRVLPHKDRDYLWLLGTIQEKSTGVVTLAHRSDLLDNFPSSLPGFFVTVPHAYGKWSATTVFKYLDETNFLGIYSIYIGGYVKVQTLLIKLLNNPKFSEQSFQGILLNILTFSDSFFVPLIHDPLIFLHNSNEFKVAVFHYLELFKFQNLDCIDGKTFLETGKESKCEKSSYRIYKSIVEPKFYNMSFGNTKVSSSIILQNILALHDERTYLILFAQFNTGELFRCWLKSETFQCQLLTVSISILFTSVNPSDGSLIVHTPYNLSKFGALDCDLFTTCASCDSIGFYFCSWNKRKCDAITEAKDIEPNKCFVIEDFSYDRKSDETFELVVITDYQWNQSIEFALIAVDDYNTSNIRLTEKNKLHVEIEQNISRAMVKVLFWRKTGGPIMALKKFPRDPDKDRPLKYFFPIIPAILVIYLIMYVIYYGLNSNKEVSKEKNARNKPDRKKASKRLIIARSSLTPVSNIQLSEIFHGNHFRTPKFWTKKLSKRVLTSSGESESSSTLRLKPSTKPTSTIDPKIKSPKVSKTIKSSQANAKSVEPFDSKSKKISSIIEEGSVAAKSSPLSYLSTKELNFESSSRDTQLKSIMTSKLGKGKSK